MSNHVFLCLDVTSGQWRWLFLTTWNSWRTKFLSNVLWIMPCYFSYQFWHLCPSPSRSMMMHISHCNTYICFDSHILFSKPVYSKVPFTWMIFDAILDAILCTKRTLPYPSQILFAKHRGDWKENYDILVEGTPLSSLCQLGGVLSQCYTTKSCASQGLNANSCVS